MEWPHNPGLGNCPCQRLSDSVNQDGFLGPGLCCCCVCVFISPSHLIHFPCPYYAPGVCQRAPPSKMLIVQWGRGRLQGKKYMKASWWTICTDFTWQTAYPPTALSSPNLYKTGMGPEICFCFVNKPADNFVASPDLESWALMSCEFVVHVDGRYYAHTNGRTREGFMEEVVFGLIPNS